MDFEREEMAFAKRKMDEMDNLSQFQSVFNPTTLVEFLLQLGKSKFSIYYFEYSLLLPIYCFDGQLKSVTIRL